MADSYPARWLGEQLVSRLDDALIPHGFVSGDALVWEGSPQETLTSVTWKRADEELTVRYEFWGGHLAVSLKREGHELWGAEAAVHFNEAVARAATIIGDEFQT